MVFKETCVRRTIADKKRTIGTSPMGQAHWARPNWEAQWGAPLFVCLLVCLLGPPLGPGPFVALAHFVALLWPYCLPLGPDLLGPTFSFIAG